MTEGEAKRLRDGRDKVDMVMPAKGSDRAGAEDEHGTDDGRGNPYRLPDAACRLLAFPGQDGNVFEAAQCAKNHLTKERQRAQGQGWGCNRERDPVNGYVPPQRPKREKNKPCINQQHGDRAGVMNPLTDLQPAKGSDGDARNHHQEDGKGRQMIFRKSSCGGTNKVGQLGRRGIEDGSDDGDCIDPEVPCRQKAAQVTVCMLGPRNGCTVELQVLAGPVGTRGWCWALPE